MREPWEEYPEIWKSKSAFFTWMRGNLRRALWEKYPPKIMFKKSLLEKPPVGYTGKAKSGACCALTGIWTGNSKLQVDHIVGEASLRGWSDVESFVKHLCTSKENMQLVETEAHKVKSYAERMGITFEDAISRKEVIAFSKLPVPEMKKVLQSHDNYETIRPVVEAMKKHTKKALVEFYEQCLKGEKIES